MSVTFYVSGRAKKLVTLPQLIKGETVKAMRRGQTRIKRAAAEGLRLRSIGRALFGEKLSGAYKNIKREKVVESPEGMFRADMKVNGVAQIQEQGGPIKPHIIRGKGSLQVRVGRRSAVRIGKELVSFAKGSVVAGWQHPGVNAMPRFPYLDAAVRSQAESIRAEVAKGVAKVAEIVSRG